MTTANERFINSLSNAPRPVDEMELTIRYETKVEVDLFDLKTGISTYTFVVPALTGTERKSRKSAAQQATTLLKMFHEQGYIVDQKNFIVIPWHRVIDVKFADPG